MAQRRRKLVRPRAGNNDDVRHAAHLRGLNLERMLTVVMDRSGPFTRAELTRATGLSAPTVGSLASHLIRGGLVRDLGVGPSRGGRRPMFMEFNARHGFVVGIDLGPRQTRLAIADLSGAPVARRVMPTPQEHTPAAVLARIANEVRVLMREAHVGPNRLLAVGASAPGAVDRERGMVVALAPDLEGWSKVPMGAILKRALRAPVVVENNVNLAILGERWQGVARGHDSCAFIWLGTGIGAGIVVNGELHHIGLGRPLNGTRVIMLIDGYNVRVIHATTGEITRDLTIDPQRRYHGTGKPIGGPRRPYGARKNKKPEP